MSKSILFVCAGYYPNPTSIGLCVHKVAKEFCGRGYDVHVLCDGDKTDWIIDQYDGIFIHRVRRKFSEQLIYQSKQGQISTSKRVFEKIGMFIIRVQQILFFPWFRMSSLHEPYRYYRGICRIHKKIHFELLCSSHAPFDGTLGAYWFKKRHLEVPYVLYILDSLTNKGNTKWISAKTNDQKGWKWECKFYSSADLIINIKCNEMHNENSRYDIFREKMYISDIPLFDADLYEHNKRDKEKIKKSRVKLVYAGRLLSHLSSPDYLCRLVSITARKRPIQMIFYSSGDCRERIGKLDREIFLYEGMVNHEELMCAYEESDILVSIGSKRAEMLPSKIFEYMSTGKKILHIAKVRDDICIEYYNKYPQALVIFEEDDIEMSSSRFLEFLDLPSVKINMGELERLFKENTPGYTVDIMEMQLKKEKRPGNK